MFIFIWFHKPSQKLYISSQLSHYVIKVWILNEVSVSWALFLYSYGKISYLDFLNRVLGGRMKYLHNNSGHPFFKNYKSHILNKTYFPKLFLVESDSWYHIDVTNARSPLIFHFSGFFIKIWHRHNNSGRTVCSGDICMQSIERWKVHGNVKMTSKMSFST